MPYRRNASEEHERAARADANEIDAVARESLRRRRRVVATLATVGALAVSAIALAGSRGADARTRCHKVTLHWETFGTPAPPPDTWSACTWK
jgi:hypothetical protein